MPFEKTPAQRAALEALAQTQPAPTDLIKFTSRGRALVFAPPQQEAQAHEAIAALAPNIAATWQRQEPPIDGYLGAFVAGEGEAAQEADIVVDFHSPPLMRRQRPKLATLPLGYFAATEEPNCLAEAKEMSGVFTKPRYFSYNADLCAHAANSVEGCNRCLDACSTQAIRSAGDKVEVNPYLCQGCAGCVMTCPSGALRYAYPSAKDMLAALRAGIGAYLRAAGHAPAVLFYAAARHEEVAAQPLPPNCLPVALEEAGAAGAEVCLAALAFGARRVAVYANNPTIAALAAEAQSVINAVMPALGLPEAMFVATTAAELPQILPAEDLPPLAPPAQFAANNNKREAFFMALNHFTATMPPAEEIIAMPAFAPFGEAQVDAKLCTLCMACAGACPAAAINAGKSAPRLTFVEENCLQCGLCQKTCPEGAISLMPRLNANKDARRQPRVLHEDKPLHCLRCNKAFASEGIIARMEEKLKTHWMFKKPEELRRLRLCEDCRVLDMFDSGKK